MSRCLVTGHMGYIGSRLFKALKEQGHNVVGVDLNEEYPKNILGLDGLKEDNKGNFHPHFFNFRPEYVFHLACFPRVPYSIKEPVATMYNNVMCTSVVLNFAKKVGVKRVIYSSSSSVVGNGDGPESPYALQKLVSEMECDIYAKLYGVDTVSLRYFNVYSKDQQADGAYATAVANWMKYIREGKTPFITGDGTQRRDMLHVSDAVSANIFAMNYKDNFNGQYFDVGTGANISLNEIKGIISEYHPDVNFEYVSPREGDVTCTLANCGPLLQLGWQTKVSIKNGIHECFKEVLK
jgi:nucleoside-diphosphate-sugar epimerase